MCLFNILAPQILYLDFPSKTICLLFMRTSYLNDFIHDLNYLTIKYFHVFFFTL